MLGGQAQSCRLNGGRNDGFATFLQMWPRVNGLRAFSFGRPGEMRDRLTDAALAGEKIATGALLQQEYLDQQESVELPGGRYSWVEMAQQRPSSRSHESRPTAF